jgi:hypothetical protein
MNKSVITESTGEINSPKSLRGWTTPKIKTKPLSDFIGARRV